MDHSRPLTPAVTPQDPLPEPSCSQYTRTQHLLTALTSASNPPNPTSSPEHITISTADDPTNRALRQIRWHATEIQGLARRIEETKERINRNAQEITDVARQLEDLRELKREAKHEVAVQARTQARLQSSVLSDISSTSTDPAVARAQESVGFQAVRLDIAGEEYAQVVQKERTLENQSQTLDREDRALEYDLYEYEKKEQDMKGEMNREEGLLGRIVGEWIDALKHKISHDEGIPSDAQMEEWTAEEEVFAQRVIGMFAEKYEKEWDSEGRWIEPETGGKT